MRVSATELKMNLGKYIEQAAGEDIIITKNGRDVAVLTNVEGRVRDALISLRGIIRESGVTTRDEIRKQRLGRYDEGLN